MNPRIFPAAGRQVELASRTMTGLETVHKCNMAGRVVLPNSFYNKVFLSRSEQGKLKPVPEEIRKARPFYSGTFGVIGARGGRLGKRLEREAYYEDQKKTLIMETEGAPADVMVCCD